MRTSLLTALTATYGALRTEKKDSKITIQQQSVQNKTLYKNKNCCSFNKNTPAF